VTYTAPDLPLPVEWLDPIMTEPELPAVDCPELITIIPATGALDVVIRTDPPFVPLPPEEPPLIIVLPPTVEPLPP
jgi:hypothetical protein